MKATTRHRPARRTGAHLLRRLTAASVAAFAFAVATVDTAEEPSDFLADCGECSPE